MTTQSEYGLFNSDTIFNLPHGGKKAIIENLLYERDNVLLLANSKVGKSTLAQHMMFNISTGEPFLGKFKTEQSPCLNCLFEGDKYEYSENMHKMVYEGKGIRFDKDYFSILYHWGFALNIRKNFEEFLELIDKGIEDKVIMSPKVIVIDNLYLAFDGDLNSSKDGANFVRHMHKLNDKYNCSIILIHHTHRARTDREGKILDEGDESFYGSFLWKAFPNHILLLKNRPGKGKVLTCNTQRSGKIIEEIEMDFIAPKLPSEPNLPLCFVLKGKFSYATQSVLDLIDGKGVTHDELMGKIDVAGNTLYRIIGELIEMGEIVKVENSFPNRWKRVVG